MSTPEQEANANGAPTSATIPDLVSQFQNLRTNIPNAGTNSSDTAPVPATSNNADNTTASTVPGWEGDPTSISALVAQAHVERSAQDASLRATSPRILVVGGSGTGKSSLINTTFGVTTAEVRAGGTPLTPSFIEHGPYPSIPIRLIDSRGLERGNSYRQQCDEIVTFITEQNQNTDPCEHVHVAWYVVGGRWERGDKDYVRRLRSCIPVIVVISKCDMDERNLIDVSSGLQAKLLLRDAIARDFDDIDIVLCGDRRKQLEGWEPLQCSCGHPREQFEEVNNRQRTWRCGFISSEDQSICEEHGTADDKLIGYSTLSNVTISKLPDAVNTAFIHAQRVNTNMKNEEAIFVIRTGVFAMTGIAMTPIPFSDMPFLLAAEGYMAVRLFNLYNIPAAFGDVAFFTGLNAIVIGAVGGAAKVVAGFLKGTGVGLPVGVVVDMTVAATSGTAVGISIARVAQMWVGSSNQITSEEFKRFVFKTVKEINLGMLLKAVLQLLIFRDQRTVVEMIQANVQRRSPTSAVNA